MSKDEVEVAPEGNLQAATEEQYETELSALEEISYYVESAMELSDSLNKIVEVTAATMGADVCSIYLFTEDRQSLVLRASKGLNPCVIDKAKLRVGEGIPGWVASHFEMVALSDGPSDSRFAPLPGSDEEAYHAYLCAPLNIREELIGAMTIRKREIYEFSEAEITLFQTICKQVSIVIEKSRLYFAKLEAERMAAIGLSLSEISHYIKNVMSNMRGGLYLVDAALKEGNLDRLRETWAVVKRSNDKIADLVQNMLSYSRNQELDLKRDNLNLLLTEILETTAQTAEERGIAVQPKFDSKLPDINFDKDSLSNAVLNLVMNAIDSIPEEKKNGKVEVGTWLDNEAKEAVLWVQDNGDGIADEDQPRIFNLFFSTKGSRGTGIGLAATKKIIEEHGGDISFHSEHGKGTTFTVRLPLRPKQSSALV